MQSTGCQDGQEDAEATNSGHSPVHLALASQSSPRPQIFPNSKCQHLQVPSSLPWLSHETKGLLLFP